MSATPTVDTTIDTRARSFLVVAIGADAETARVAREWTTLAEGVAPTTLAVLDDIDAPSDLATLADVAGSARVGVRILVVGGRYDAHRAVALLREHGALPVEIQVSVTHADDLPVYCAHCRDIRRVVGEPGGLVECPGCARLLEVHDLLATAMGCYLASDSRAREVTE
ncbi:dimethylamine monooxygenase subunit DmmA family protein [Nocardioides sp. GY 10113]|uniref:dimethylamine monooxygenase subunit DmmA family protein n=1 Tax=Nocardioides sp. GY 10113 TaxID=2569761 RepID=UPI0014585E92|nr:dimethylamine monooxygenase subunit DmmA family protein [Nocardioides sp. GY 10113]